MGILCFLLINTMYGCKKQTEEIKKIEIDNGAIAIENNGSYKIYNLNNMYKFFYRGEK